MAGRSASRKSAPQAGNRAVSARKTSTQTTLVASDWAKKPPPGHIKGKKPDPAPNGNILAFFKKAEDINNRIFLQERGACLAADLYRAEEDEGWTDEQVTDAPSDFEVNSRYNESEVSCKKRRVGEGELTPTPACSPPPPVDLESAGLEALAPNLQKPTYKPPMKSGPFLDDSESEDDHHDNDDSAKGLIAPSPLVMESGMDSLHTSEVSHHVLRPSSRTLITTDLQVPEEKDLPCASITTNPDFYGDVDYDIDLDDDLEGEEYDERRWMNEQMKLERAEMELDEPTDDFDAPSISPKHKSLFEEEVSSITTDMPYCPICNCSLQGIAEQEISIHVNACLDGQPVPTPSTSSTSGPRSNARVFKKPSRPAKPGQSNPFQLNQPEDNSASAFSKLMAGHAEDAAWATAAAENNASRGKPAYQRTCPFYKIMPGFFIAVDAFRYGAIKGQNAYFLSHFHSDHYIGLTASWSHGPIYCSKVTANLVRQQLRVDPQWVVDLDFDKKIEVPDTQGVYVTMIPANHCPGSSLFLFEKQIGGSTSSKLRRVLHCGDFRACQNHIQHPLLRPNVLDTVTGKERQQKLDVCYLDTTYLNPKYAFPPQQQVIQACADMCVSLSKSHADQTDGWEQMKRERAGQGMIKFVSRESDANDNNSEPSMSRGRLLVVVGTYSIGKERICVGIAKALNSKIYAPPNKQRICRALEDPELEALLTSDPRAAQVHMTPLFEIRADTLDDYLRDYTDTFSRCVGFRPSGWNYRPPNSRFVESPSVQTVLSSENWRSHFSMKDLTPQRGSTSRSSCFGVPYSEHSSFRELTIFCCALRIDKIIPTVNVGSAKSREKMKAWCERWALERRKNGLFQGGDHVW